MPSHPHAHPLIGTWKLERFRVWAADGSESEPKGRQPFGYARFDPSGVALIQLANSDPSLSASDRAASYVAYSGPFRVEPEAGRVTITVEASNRADYLGTTQVRDYVVDGRHLQLGTPGQYQATCVRVAAG
jgi:hypothetical protein